MLYGDLPRAGRGLPTPPPLLPTLALQEHTVTPAPTLATLHPHADEFFFSVRFLPVVDTHLLDLFDTQ